MSDELGAFMLEGRRVGGPRCFVIAEAGVNHNGRLDLARRLVDAAADAGADAIKFQTFQPELVAAASAPRAPYQMDADGSTTQLDMLRDLVLPRDAYRELQRRARDIGLVFLSTPFDEPSARFLDDLNVSAFKVASGELTNLPFLQALASMRKPLLLSTGMSTLVEVEAAMDVIGAASSAPVALLHCVSAYPAPADACNLAAIATLRRRFSVPAGWSDHTQGTAIALAAVALGAEVLEKHITLDRTLPGPDHAASLEPHEFRAMTASARDIEAAVGDGVKRSMPVEHAVAAVARRGLHVCRDLPAGHQLTGRDLVALRPARGLPPARFNDVVGRRLLRPLSAGDALLEEHIGV
jgi:N-acetylneuraminate synthase/N,N'-diacetyllegionaminate synthase